MRNCFSRRIGPVENKAVAYVALGEGWHNYHHVFPWDYKAAELGVGPNLTTKVLHFFTWLGWAYDLKSPSPQLVERMCAKYGDGTRGHYEVLPPGELSSHDNNGVVLLSEEHDKIIK